MITSMSNAKIKRLVNLKKKRRLRDQEKVFLVEGLRMFEEIPDAELLELYMTETFYKRRERLAEARRQASGCRTELLSDAVMESVSDTMHPQGVLCVARQRRLPRPEKWLAEAKDGQAPLLLFLDNIQDPGNLGTILRTAEAAGVTGVIMSPGCVDIYNPKVIRSTMGSVFRMPFWYAEEETELILELKNQGVRTYAAHLGGEMVYDEPDYREPTAFFVGNEGNGLREEIAELADMYVKIPMAGRVESLNAAAAATVLMFEAGRQRRH